MRRVAPETIIEIAKKASEFKSSIVLSTNNKHIDVKSILGLSITLMTSYDFTLEIHGPDEEEAKKEMVKVFHNSGLHVVII